MFSKQLIDYTESTFKQSKIEILTKTMVKEVKENTVVMQMPDKSIKEVPYGLLVWAGVSPTNLRFCKIVEYRICVRRVTRRDKFL
jgi:NADH dehydrogenase FAD-containing subunit